MMPLFKKRDRLDPDEIARQASEATEQLRAQQPHVNAITTYLNNRNRTNGFGQDFEFTFIAKESR